MKRQPSVSPIDCEARREDEHEQQTPRQAPERVPDVGWADLDDEIGDGRRATEDEERPEESDPFHCAAGEAGRR